MENNIIEILGNSEIVNTEELSISNGSIIPSTVSVSDTFDMISGTCTTPLSFQDGEAVDVTVLGKTRRCRLQLHDNNFYLYLNIPNDDIIEHIESYHNVAMLRYTDDEVYRIIDSGSSEFDVNELVIDKRPYIIVDDQYIHFDIESNGFLTTYGVIDGVKHDIIQQKTSGTYGETLHIYNDTYKLNCSNGDIYYAYINADSETPIEVNDSASTVTVLGVDYPITRNGRYTIHYDNQDVEIYKSDNGSWYIVNDDTVSFSVSDNMMSATTLVYGDIAGSGSVLYTDTYLITSHDCFTVGGVTYTVTNGMVSISNTLLGRFVVYNKENDYSAELQFLGNDEYMQLGIGVEYLALTKNICTFITTNRTKVYLVKQYSAFGNEAVGKDDINSRIQYSLSIRHYFAGYTVPVLFQQRYPDNLSQEDLINHNYFDSIVDDELKKKGNRLVDMERDMYIPAYKKGAYGDYFDSDFTPVSEIRFNLHFRTRRLSDWSIIEDDKSSESIDMCNWFATDYYRPEEMLMPRNDGTQSSLYTDNIDKKLYRSSDLLGFLGFTEKDIKERKKKLSKSFIRLSFFDSPNPANQSLMYSTTIYTNINKLCGSYMRNMHSKNMFFNTEDGDDGFVTTSGSSQYFHDMRIACSVESCGGNTLKLRYGVNSSPLFTTGDTLYVRAAVNGFTNQSYKYVLASESNIDFINRKIILTGTGLNLIKGSTAYVYRVTEITDDDNRYLFDNECDVFSEEYELKKENDSNGKVVYRYCPTFSIDNRLSSQFITKNNSVIDQSSDGFYMYLFKKYGEALHVKTLYMKVEYNHAGYGITIPFMVLRDSTGAELSKMSQITSDIKAGYELKDVYNNMYIPVNVVYDTKLDKYVWYYKNNHTNVLNFNLFEVKYKAVENISSDCALELDNYGDVVGSAAGTKVIHATGIYGNSGITIDAGYPSWVHPTWVKTSAGYDIVVNYDTFPVSLYQNKTADDPTLQTSRQATITVREADSKYKNCYCSYDLEQGIQGYLFTSRPYYWNGDAKEYISGTTTFTVPAYGMTYYVDILTDKSTWSHSVQSYSGSTFNVVDNIDAKKSSIICSNNVGSERQTTLNYSTSSISGEHNSSTVKIVQVEDANLFYIQPNNANAFKFDVNAGTKVYTISSHTPISTPTISTAGGWCTISSFTQTSAIGATPYVYNMVLSYASNMPGAGVEYTDTRTGTITFIVDGVSTPYTLTQVGYVKPSLFIDFEHLQYYKDSGLTLAYYPTSLGVSRSTTGLVTVKVQNDGEYWIKVTGTSSFDVANYRVTEVDEHYSIDTSTSLNADGKTYTLTMVIHSKTLPYDINDRRCSGQWVDFVMGSTIGEHVYLIPSEWSTASIGNEKLAVRFFDGSTYTYKKMNYVNLQGCYMAQYSGDIDFVSCAFMKLDGNFNELFPTSNVLEMTKEVLKDGTYNRYQITNGYWQNNYKIYNSIDEPETATTCYLKLMQPSDRSMNISGFYQNPIPFTKNGGKQKFTITLKPKSSYLGINHSEKYKIIYLTDGNGSVYGGANYSEFSGITNNSTGVYNFFVKSKANDVLDNKVTSIDTFSHLYANNMNSALTIANVSAQTEPMTYICSLNYAEYSSHTFDFSSNGTVTHVSGTTLSCTEDMNFTFGNERKKITYSIDNIANKLTLNTYEPNKVYITSFPHTRNIQYGYTAMLNGEEMQFNKTIQVTINLT